MIMLGMILLGVIVTLTVILIGVSNLRGYPSTTPRRRR